MAYDSDDKKSKKNRGAYDTGNKAARKYKLQKKSKQDLSKVRKQKLKDKGFRKSKARSNKTQTARDILSKKHGIKKASARVDGKYVLDHEQITDLMNKMGFDFSDRKGSWVTAPKSKSEPEKSPEKDKPKIKSVKDFKKDKEKIDDVSDEGDPEPAQVRDEIDDPPISFKDMFFNQDEEDLEDVNDINDIEDEEWYTDVFAKGKDGETYHITEREVMIFEARFLLALIWEEYDFTKYTLNKDGDLWGELSRRDALRAMKALSLEWEEYKDLWVDSEGNEVWQYRKDHEETKKTIIGRSLLANMNFLGFIEFDVENKKPRIHPDEVDKQMSKQDFRWNSSDEIWEYVGTDHRADYGSLGHKRGAGD